MEKFQNFKLQFFSSHSSTTIVQHTSYNENLVEKTIIRQTSWRWVCT